MSSVGMGVWGLFGKGDLQIRLKLTMVAWEGFPKAGWGWLHGSETQSYNSAAVLSSITRRFASHHNLERRAYYRGSFPQGEVISHVSRGLRPTGAT